MCMGYDFINYRIVYISNKLSITVNFYEKFPITPLL